MILISSKFWILCGIVGLIIFLFTKPHWAIKAFERFGLLASIGLLFLAVLGGGVTLVLSIIFTLAFKKS